MSTCTRWVIVSIVAHLLSFPLALAGQAEVRSVSVGERVRVTPIGEQPLIGVVTSLQLDRVDVSDSSNISRSIPFEALRSVERSLGTKGHGWRGAAIGAAISGGLMLFALGSICDTLPAECEGAFTKVAIASGIGTAFGAAIGSSIRTERWASVPIERGGVRAPSPNGPRVSLEIQF